MSLDLVHYVILRGDLGWKTGALATQAVHASNECLFKFLHQDDDSVKKFLEAGSNMRVILKQAPTISAFNSLSTSLTELHLDHIVWVEQPENIPVAIAIKPYCKEKLFLVLKSYPLFQ